MLFGDRLVCSSNGVELVDIIKSAEAIAEAVSQLHLNKNERRGPVRYVGMLVHHYIQEYVDCTNTVPSRSVFANAINEYVDSVYCGDNLRYSKQIKELIRDLIFTPYNNYKGKRQSGWNGQVHRPAGNFK